MSDEERRRMWSRRRWVGGGLGMIGSLLGLGAFWRWPARRAHEAGGRQAMKGQGDATTLQPIAHVLRPAGKHWVGDGFHVSTIFSPFHLDPQLLSPFVLLDHAAPREFAPAAVRRGVGEHPHRGFETVTFAYQGEIEHRDSGGGGGKIGPGEVQWMTAASGVVHEELHSHDFTQTGGTFEMVQLWVNLPAKLKMSPPRYQAISRGAIVHFKHGDANGRLIAGRFDGVEGPAKTHTPITVFDLELEAAGGCRFALEAGTTTLVLVLAGAGRAQQSTPVAAGDLLVFDRDHPGEIAIEAQRKTRALVLNGAPLHEPVVAYGPFVMNTREEIRQAMLDYESGKMGHLDTPS